MYLSGNSLLTVFLSSSASCYLTSSSLSLLYSFSNSFTSSIAFFKFPLLSYISFSAVYPFCHTRYLSLLRIFLLFMIFSTSHSFSPSITTSYDTSFLCPSPYGLYLHTLLTLTTECILIVLGNSNSITLLEIIAFTL